jgi:sugar phosphate isomerase/epimerase
LKEPQFKISLAEWSLHRSLWRGKVKHLDFPRIARETFNLDAIELVNSFFKKPLTQKQLADFKRRADDAGVKILLIMCDFEGKVGDASERRRLKAVENHRKWLDAAKFFGCHSIRVNALSSGSPAEQRERVAEGLRRLSEHAAPLGLNVLVENHGGISSDASWLVSVIEKVNLPNCGTLPDFGNFKISLTREYDRYRGMGELMPHARAVSAKSQKFDKLGNETRVDYRRVLRIVLEAGYRGYIGIEYSGLRMTELDGIRATKWLLEKHRDELAFGLPSKSLLS